MLYFVNINEWANTSITKAILLNKEKNKIAFTKFFLIKKINMEIIIPATIKTPNITKSEGTAKSCNILLF